MEVTLKAVILPMFHLIWKNMSDSRMVTIVHISLLYGLVSVILGFIVSISISVLTEVSVLGFGLERVDIVKNFKDCYCY